MVLMKTNKRINRKGRKFLQKWLGLYTVTKLSEKWVVTLKNTSGLILNKKYNVYNLRHYFQEEFDDTSSTAIRSSNFWSDAPDEIVVVFFSIWVFFHEHSWFTGQQGNRVGIYLTPLYHFHLLHRYLDKCWAITAESSSLHTVSSRTRNGNLWFPNASR